MSINTPSVLPGTGGPGEGLGFVEEAIQQSINFFNSRRNYNRRMALLFTIMPTSLSAIATVLIGASEKLQLKWPLIVAMTATGAATVLGAWHELFSNRKLWVANNSTLAGLYKLQWDIGFRKEKTAPLTQTEVDAFYARFQQIQDDAEQVLKTTRST
ncbi:MAG TPA: SLATT domain-containing protein [Pyrinomonadaceae bacterium]